MAEGQKSGGKGRKLGRSKRNASGATQSQRTNARKLRNVEKQKQLRARPLSSVSLNCVKNRAKRGDERAREFLRSWTLGSRR